MMPGKYKKDTAIAPEKIEEYRPLLNEFLASVLVDDRHAGDIAKSATSLLRRRALLAEKKANSDS